MSASLSTRIINERFAAGREHLHLEAVLRSEAVADAAERLVRRRVREIAATLELGNILDRLRELPETLIRDMAARLARLVPWMSDRTERLYAQTIPRIWWRAEYPALVFAEQSLPPSAPSLAEDKDPGRDFVPPLQPANDLEPILASKNLGPAEFQRLLKQVVFDPPTEDEVRRILSAPINGKAWPDRLRDLSRIVGDVDGLARRLAQAYAGGASLDEMEKLTRPFADNVSASARRIARTEGLRIANETARAKYKHLGNMLQGVQIVATLDENTRPHHAARNGTIYWAVPGKTPTLAELPQLPDEPNCRCYDQPVLTPPPGAKDPKFQTRFTAATGNLIPDPAAYAQWFQNVDVGRQKMAVGARRYEAVRKKVAPSGQQPTWFDFIDKEGRLRPLAALQAETRFDRLERVRVVSGIAREREVLFKQVASFGFVSGGPGGKPPAKPRPSQPTPGTPAAGGPPAGITFSGVPTDTSTFAWDARRKIGPIDSEKKARKLGKAVRLHLHETNPELREARDRMEEARKFVSDKKTPPTPAQAVEFIFSKARYLGRAADAYRQAVAQIRDVGDENLPLQGTGQPLAVVRAGATILPADWLRRIRMKLGQDALLVVEDPDAQAGGAFAYDEQKIKVGPTAPRSTGVHELIHVIEWSDKVFAELGKAFRTRRAKGYALKKIIIDKTEVGEGWKDKFTWHYMGRDYGNVQFTEILTCGVEGVLEGQYNLVSDDLDMTDFILGMLAGY